MTDSSCITQGLRAAHECIADHGPLTTADVAEHLGLTNSGAKKRIASLVAAGHIAAHPDRAKTEKGWARQWIAGPQPLPAAQGNTRPSAPRVTRAEPPSPATITAIVDAAIANGLNPRDITTEDLRVSISHPLGLPGRVWLDSIADVDAVIREGQLIAAGICQPPAPYDLIQEAA